MGNIIDDADYEIIESAEMKPGKSAIREGLYHIKEARKEAVKLIEENAKLKAGIKNISWMISQGCKFWDDKKEYMKDFFEAEKLL